MKNIMSENVLKGFIVEDSRSRSGKHIAKSLLFIYKKNSGLVSVSKAGDKIVNIREAKPTYAKGSAKEYSLILEHGDYAIRVWLVKNFLGKVKGFIEVYNHRGELVYRAKYYDGELRKSIGNPIYAWLVRLVVEKLRIPVKKTRLGDERG